MSTQIISQNTTQYNTQFDQRPTHREYDQAQMLRYAAVNKWQEGCRMVDIDMETARDLFEDAKVLEAQADMLDHTPEECTCSPDGRYTCPTCRDFAYTFFGE